MHPPQNPSSIFPIWVTQRRLCVEQFLVHPIRLMRKASLLDETPKKESRRQQEAGKMKEGALRKVVSKV